MRNTLSRLLFLSAIVCFALSSAPARAAVSVVNSDNVKTAIFQNTELSQYTYSSNSLVADWKLCKFNENTAYTFTNTINVVITSITFEGVVDNNNDRSQSVTISKGAEALTSQITWNNRKSTSLSSTTIDVSSLSISKDSKVTITADFNLALRLVVTYAEEIQYTYGLSLYNHAESNQYYPFAPTSNAHEYVIEDFTIPKSNDATNGAQYWVGTWDNTKNEAKWADFSNADQLIKDLCLTTNNDMTVGRADGAKGTLHIWDDNKESRSNLWIKFTPAGYGMSWGADGGSSSFVPFSQVEGYKWQTDFVTISTTARDSWKYWVGFSASPSGYVSSTTKSKTLELSTIGVVTSNSTISGDVSTLTADTKGKFEIYDNSTDKNWFVHFIPHYHVAYDEQGGSEVADGEYYAINAGKQTITLPAAPTKKGYRFQGWKYEGTSYAAGASYSFTPSADITFTAVWEPTLKATTRYLIANAGVSAGALATNLTGAKVGVIKYDGTTYSVSDDISLNTYPGTKVYYYAETHLDHLGTEQDWSGSNTANTTVQALKFIKGTYTLQLGNLTATKIAFYGGCDKARTLTIAGTDYVYSGAQFIAQEVSGSFTGNVDVETSGEIYGVLLIDVEAGESCPTPAVAITEGFNDGTRTTFCADDADFNDWAGWTATITVEGMGEDEQCLVSWVSPSNLTDTLQKTTYTYAQGITKGDTTTFTSTYRAPKGGTYNVQATVSASGKTSAHAKTSPQLRLLTAPAKPTLTANIAPGAVAQGDVVKMTSSSNTNLWEYSTDGGDTW